MKKLDKLILKSFLGPFILTTVVVVFILLCQTMIKYFDDFAGKGLGIEVFAELLFYFAIFTTPVALPLAVLLSSLMTFGNLGEHSELTAIKGSGISLIRALMPIFGFTVVISFLAYFNNNYIVPKANLKAYSLLYDIKMKKPALDIKEGAFYNGIRGLSIKVNKKDGDGNLEEVIIYDHREGGGNTNVILAERGKMYTIMNEKYLTLELYDGRIYRQVNQPNRRRIVAYNEVEPYQEDRFASSKLVLSLAEFQFTRTDEELFSTNRLMLNVNELNYFIDSLRNDLTLDHYNVYYSIAGHLPDHIKDRIEPPKDLTEKKREIDSIRNERYNRMMEMSRNEQYAEADSSGEQKMEERKGLLTLFKKKEKEEEPKVKSPSWRTPSYYPSDYRYFTGSYYSPFGRRSEAQVARAERTDSIVAALPADSVEAVFARIDSVIEARGGKAYLVANAIEKARSAKAQIGAEAERLFNSQHSLRKYEIEKHKKFAQAFACLVMFLVGAPLGSIIKKGGLGVPVIISIFFFIVYYVVSMTGEKWARQGLITPFWGVWDANFVLLPLGFFFLKQARVDARLFDSDYYNVLFSRIKEHFQKLKIKRYKFGKNMTVL